MVNKNLKWVLRKPIDIMLNIEDENYISSIYKKSKASGYSYTWRVLQVFEKNRLIEIYTPSKCLRTKEIRLTDKGNKVKEYVKKVVDDLDNDMAID